MLVLADGTALRGRSIGARGAAVGEVVFNTAMTGYQEILTDPSYCRQIVTLTHPHIGNTGANAEDEEAPRIYAEGLVVRDLPRLHSSWRARQDLGSYLKEQEIVGIAGIDTRKLTRILREKGAQNGCLMAGEVDLDEALERARAFPGLAGMDLAKAVCTAAPYERGEGRFHVVAYDYGIKRNILRMLAERDTRLTVVPAQFPAREVLRMRPDGVFLSNGPGDPKMCKATIENTRRAMQKNTPMLGVCLGSQIMALAAGANTYKLKYGHRSHNQPCNEMGTKRCYITSQNHGYAVDAETLPEDWRQWFVNDNVGTNEGLIHISKPFFAAQFHPEASPGPDDSEFIFDMFLRAL